METQQPSFPMIRYLLIGITLIFGPLLAYAGGAFENWQPIGPPPVADYNFAGVYQAGFGSGNLVVRGANDVLYRYTGSGAPEWDRLVQAEFVVEAPCLERAIIARFKQPFRQETSCLSTIVPSEWLGGTRVTYVRDAQSQLWLWKQDNGNTFLALALPAIFFGSIIGYFLALVGNPLMLVLRPPAPAARAARWQALFAWLMHTLRVGARVWSIFSVILLLGLNLVATENSLRFRVSLLLGLLALAAAWRWERLGSALTLLCFAAGLVIFILDFPYDLRGGLLLLTPIYLPAALFLAAGVLKRRQV
jgi:hypothetical protein